MVDEWRKKGAKTKDQQGQPFRKGLGARQEDTAVPNTDGTREVLCM